MGISGKTLAGSYKYTCQEKQKHAALKFSGNVPSAINTARSGRCMTSTAALEGFCSKRYSSKQIHGLGCRS